LSVWLLTALPEPH